MFCASALVAGICVLACNGTHAEFRNASAHWGNATVTGYVDDQRQLLERLRSNRSAWFMIDSGVIWAAESEPSYCYPVPMFKPEHDR